MPSFIRFAIAAALAAAAASVQAADDDERCRELIQQQPRPAIALCENAYAAAAVRGDARAAEDALARRSDAELALGEYAAAARTLDRVAALPGAAAWEPQFRLLRRRGMLAYRQEQIAESLVSFRAALALATAQADLRAQGQSWNDIGIALRRSGELRGALEAFLASLERKRAAGDTALGALLNNLGDIQRELGDAGAARQRYDEALAAFEAGGRVLDAAHTREALGLLAAQTGDAAGAARFYARAAADYERAGAGGDQLRLTALLLRAALDAGDIAGATAHAERGAALARQLGLPEPAALVAQRARLLRLSGRLDGVRQLIQAALDRVHGDRGARIDLLYELAAASEAGGDYAAALKDWRAWRDADVERLGAEHDRRLEQLRVRFDVAEKERRIAALDAENRLRALEIDRRAAQQRATLLAVLVGLLLLAAAIWRWRQRERVQRAVRAAQLADEIERYRREAAALAADRGRLQALLDNAANAVVALDAGGGIVALNAPAALRWNLTPGRAVGTDMRTLLAAGDAARFDAALADMDERDTRVALELGGLAAAALAPLGGGLAVLSFAADSAGGAGGRDAVGHDAAASNAVTPDGAAPDSATRNAAAPDVAVSGDDAVTLEASSAEERDAYRRALVELMLAAVAAWERSTGKTRIDLAEASRIWRITIDEGRLRVRALERYLSLAKLPRRPRWREVLRTVYYVLTECPLEPAEREALKRRLEQVQDAVRRRSLA
ncbi:tetratricopeptide repeat protein [Tahibacter sp. P2K]|uniref:Tetratricopeptide repeat protein n=1 Tax=Tahibacter harae TaxID=2963937 RepID=A0ABT1QR44_9GAMM|nr:tetratricopeptide repeat protein [Tahibacter harae]